MGSRFADRFAQFVDDEIRRRQIRVAHPEVDDVGAVGPRRSFQAIDLFKHVWRQASYLVEFIHDRNRIVIVDTRTGTSLTRSISTDR